LMLKDTKSLGNNKAPACESRGFVRKRKKVCILTHLLLFSYSFLSAFFIVLQASATYPAIQRMCAATERRFAVSAPSGSHRDR
ncbi:hypothetical protein PO079_15200, partial [Bacteroides stercoris]|nr:hypothetical protein [Bacteroides stercoris]MDC2331808.1 hypothetical protein [Bacteroides stercoris]MDC2338105.1 hypothetical protein [Bacteroides stercoris]